jgi:hypothetical protein
MMLEIILVIISILAAIKLLNETASLPKEDPEYKLPPSIVEIEEVEDSKGNPVFLVYYNGDFLMQDTTKETLETKLQAWLDEQGAQIIEPTPAKR